MKNKDTETSLISSLDDTTYVVGPTNQNVTWTVFVFKPSHFDLVITGTFKLSDSRSTGYITINVTGLQLGTYEYILICFDEFDNQ